MAASARLRVDGQPVAVGPVRLRTPGMQGTAAALPPTHEVGLEAVARSGVALDAALEREALTAQHAVLVEPTGPVPDDAAALELEVLESGAGLGQLLLHVDARGFASWHLAAEPHAGPAPAAGIRRYSVPAPLAHPGAAKLLAVLAFPLADPALGRVGERGYAAAWERAQRPHRLRALAREPGAAAPLAAAAWRPLQSGRALLFLHDAFGRTPASFGALPPPLLAELQRRYQGRVLAFDHPTLTVDPLANARWLVEQLPDGTELDLDLVCHGRGGLVGRLLVERQDRLGLGLRRVDVHQAAFLATPNAGTPLAGPGRLGALLDAWTTLLAFPPVPGAADALQAVAVAAKQLAAGAPVELPGVAAMDPEGPFLSRLNAGPRLAHTGYHAVVSADAGSRAAGLARLARGLLDPLLGGLHDLAVPAGSVWQKNGSDWFPIEDRLLLGAGDGVAHAGYAASPAVHERLLRWLDPDAA